MKGQYSLDFLLTTAGFVAFFVAVSGMMLNFGGVVISGLNTRTSVLSARLLSDKVNSMCTMSSGSELSIKLYFPTQTKLRAGHELTVITKYGSKEITKYFYTNCPVWTNNALDVHGVYLVHMIRKPSGVDVSIKKL